MFGHSSAPVSLRRVHTAGSHMDASLLQYQGSHLGTTTTTAQILHWPVSNLLYYITGCFLTAVTESLKEAT